MRGKWELTSAEVDKWLLKGLKISKQFKNNEISICDLTKEDITPVQVHLILEELGWKSTSVEEDAEMGYWFKYEKADSRPIILYTSAMTFELAVFLEEDSAGAAFKEQHLKNMLN